MRHPQHSEDEKDVKPEDIAKASYEVSNKKIQIPSNELSLLIDPKECVSRRRSRGSSSPTEVRKLIRTQGKAISKCQAVHRKLMEALKKSSEALRSEVGRYLA